jgi:hypothetical protein
LYELDAEKYELDSDEQDEAYTDPVPVGAIGNVVFAV